MTDSSFDRVVQWLTIVPRQIARPPHALLKGDEAPSLSWVPNTTFKNSHGCSKIGATRAAENGASVAQLDVIFG